MPKQVWFSRVFAEGESILEDLPPDLAGTPDGRMLALFVISEALRQGVRLAPKDAEFLATALRSISEGEDPRAALGILRGRGEKSTQRSEDRDLRWCCQIALLRENEALSVEKAIERIAPTAHASTDTIWSAWKRYGKYVEVSKSGWAFYMPESTNSEGQSR